MRRRKWASIPAAPPEAPDMGEAPDLSAVDGAPDVMLGEPDPDDTDG